jgi:hypothetical protein
MPFVMLTYIIYIYVIICKNDPFRLDMQQIPQPGFLSETLQGVEVGSVARWDGEQLSKTLWKKYRQKP